MKYGMICPSHAAQLPVLNAGANAAQHFMNQATFHSIFPILVITKIKPYCRLERKFLLVFTQG